MPATVSHTTICTHLGVRLIRMYFKRPTTLHRPLVTERVTGHYSRSMGYGFRWTIRGARYALRGLQEGRMSLVALGVFMILGRLATRRRPGTRVAGLRLDPGSSAALRVSRPGDDPVTFRVDSLR